jgi:DNA-binding CsgD family transcriptional regulator
MSIDRNDGKIKRETKEKQPTYKLIGFSSAVVFFLAGGLKMAQTLQFQASFGLGPYISMDFQWVVMFWLLAAILLASTLHRFAAYVQTAIFTGTGIAANLIEPSSVLGICMMVIAIVQLACIGFYKNKPLIKIAGTGVAWVLIFVITEFSSQTPESALNNIFLIGTAGALVTLWTRRLLKPVVIERVVVVQEKKKIDLKDSNITNRESEFLELLSLGLGIKEISSQMGISNGTASKHSSNIARKFNAPIAEVAHTIREADVVWVHRPQGTDKQA